MIRRAATVIFSIPAATEFAPAPRKGTKGERCIMPAVRQSVVAPSLKQLSL